MISIYIHIPFCIKKCAYCDFLSFPSDDETIQRYVDCLCNEIGGCEADDRNVATIFFGGGTPSILGADQIEQLMAKIKSEFNIIESAEISMECNPGTVTEEKLKGFLSAGINRLSIGLQSANDNELKNLGRIHNYEQFLFTYNTARKVGFKNINIDLMSALPGQTIDSFRESLTNVVGLKPQHLSAYSLIIEEDTEFWGLYGDDKSVKSGDENLAKLPDEDAERAMYYLTKEVLDRFGYHRYEISNYALPGYECEHNKVYWTGGDYISFGIGAASFYKGVRYNNISDVTRYLEIWSDDKVAQKGEEVGIELVVTDKDIFDVKESGVFLLKNKLCHTDICQLTDKDLMEEYMFVGLRMMEGVSISGFENRFGISMNEVYCDIIKKYTKDDYLMIEGDRLMLTKKGIDVSNVILADFLLD